MKPAGRERDKEIAEKRGDRCMYYSDIPIEFGKIGPACIGHSMAFPDNCKREGETYCLAYEDKLYSTDISYAMELELPCNKYHEITYKMSEGFFTEIWHQSKLIFTSGVNKNEAESKADARSGAWLKWREHETVQR